MSAWPSILHKARLSLLIFAGTLALCAAVVGGSLYVRKQYDQKLSALRADVEAQQSALLEKSRELSNVQTNIDKYRALQQQGLVETPDRAAWIEQLLTSRRLLKLPETLTYTLKSPAPLPVPGQEAAQPGSAPPADPNAPLIHDLEFSLRDIHEDDLVLLIRDLRTRLHGRFRVQSCRLDTPAEAGLAAQCTIRLFTLPQAGRAPSLLSQPPLSCRAQPCC